MELKGGALCGLESGEAIVLQSELQGTRNMTQNWRGRALVCREVVVKLIGPVTTREGLTLQSELDEHVYASGRKVSVEQLETLSIDRATVQGEWNDTLAPRSQYDQVIQAKLLNVVRRRGRGSGGQSVNGQGAGEQMGSQVDNREGR